MGEKMIVDRRKTARLLGALARELGGVAVPALEGRFAQVLRQGETLPDFPFILELLARKLEERSELVTSSHEGLRKRLDLAISLRSTRDEAAAAVRGMLLKIRGAVTIACGKEMATNVLGFDGRTARQPEELLFQAQRVLARLTEGSFNLPMPALAGLQLDSSAWPDLLGAPAAALERALDALSAGAGKVEARAANKQISLRAFDHLHQRTARLLRDLLRYAGEDELAGYVQLAYRRERAAAGEPEPASPPNRPASD